MILEIDVNEIIGGAFNIQEISWSPAGDYILIWNTRNVKILNLEGNVVSTLAMTISYNEGSYAECGIDNLPHWLDEHTIAYTDAEKSRFIIQNVETEYRLFDINVPADKARLVDFAPDQAQLLLYTVDSADIRNQTYSVWYISLEDGTAVPLQEDTPFPSGCDDRAFYTSAWRDSSLVRFVMDDGGIALFSPQNQNVSRVPLPAEGVNHHYTPLRWGNDQLIYMWFNSHLPSSMSIYSYNLANGETTLLVDGQVIDLPAGVNYFSPINRGRFLASSFLVSVVDGSIREIPELNQQDGDLPQEVQWHPSGEWFFMLESSVGYGLQGVHVVGTETEQQRYITACLHDSQSCFGWLPETD